MCLWRSEGYLWKSVLASRHVGPGNWPQIRRPNHKGLYLLGLSNSPHLHPHLCSVPRTKDAEER